MTTNKKNHGIVLITGASAGIGRELALEFGARAEALVLVARRLDRLEKLREELLGRYPGLKVVAFAADLSDEHEIERLLAKVSEQAGAVDVIVNNAGLGDSVLFDRSEWARTRQVLRTNIFAVAQLTSALVPGMVERRRGGVLNIGSGAGLAVLPNAATYAGASIRSRIQRSATRRPFGNRRNCDTSVPRSGRERIRSSSRFSGRHDRHAPALLPDHCRPVRARGTGRIRARRGSSFPRPRLSVCDENAAADSVVDVTQAGRQDSGSAASGTDKREVTPRGSTVVSS
jgi:NADP-dependent 3-hydroxy acid dehydrogenase YdfG